MILESGAWEVQGVNSAKRARSLRLPTTVTVWELLSALTTPENSSPVRGWVQDKNTTQACSQLNGQFWQFWHLRFPGLPATLLPVSSGRHPPQDAHSVLTGAQLLLCAGEPHPNTGWSSRDGMA